MNPQCSYFQNYSDLLTLLQCQRVTNVTIAVQVHINFKKKKKKKKKVFFFVFFGAEIPCQIIVKSASDAEIPLPRKNRGSMEVFLGIQANPNHARNTRMTELSGCVGQAGDMARQIICTQQETPFFIITKKLFFPIVGHTIPLHALIIK